MFLRKKEKTLLDVTIDAAFSELNRHPVGSEQYVKTLDILTRLHALEDVKSSRLSKDTLATVGANLLGILMIIHHEHLHPITSRATQLLIRPKI
jgi:hypothetical protein